MDNVRDGQYNHNQQNKHRDIIGGIGEAINQRQYECDYEEYSQSYVYLKILEHLNG